MTGQNPIVRAEHVVELVHGIDDRLGDLAHTKGGSKLRSSNNHAHDRLSLTVWILTNNFNAGATVTFPPVVILRVVSTLSPFIHIKSQLTTALDDKGPPYSTILQLYLKALVSRYEFEDQIRECLDGTPHLRTSSLTRPSTVHLLTSTRLFTVQPVHNSLVISPFDITSHLKPQPSPHRVNEGGRCLTSLSMAQIRTL